jgi:alkylhydroperoxidase family enzyme
MRRTPMTVINAIPREKAPDDVKPVYDNLSKTFGRVPNIFGVMAHRPGALKSFLGLYGAVMNEGTVEARYKELAYLKTSLVNGCEY